MRFEWTLRLLKVKALECMHARLYIRINISEPMTSQDARHGGMGSIKEGVLWMRSGSACHTCTMCTSYLRDGAPVSQQGRGEGRCDGARPADACITIATSSMRLHHLWTPALFDIVGNRDRTPCNLVYLSRPPASPAVLLQTAIRYPAGKMFSTLSSGLCITRYPFQVLRFRVR